MSIRCQSDVKKTVVLRGAVGRNNKQVLTESGWMIRWATRQLTGGQARNNLLDVPVRRIRRRALCV
jgi:hypothetical protein